MLSQGCSGNGAALHLSFGISRIHPAALRGTAPRRTADRRRLQDDSREMYNEVCATFAGIPLNLYKGLI